MLGVAVLNALSPARARYVPHVPSRLMLAELLPRRPGRQARLDRRVAEVWNIDLCRFRSMAATEVRITTTVARVLRQFLEDPAEPCYGFDLMRATGLASGTLYVILARLQRAGWLTSTQEDVDPSAVGRPARRLYRLTAEGAAAARVELAALSEQLRPPTRACLRPGLHGGQP